MLGALTVRKLKPGAYENFKAAFMPEEGVEVPAGWKRCAEYERRRAAVDALVESVGVDSVFEVVEERSMG
jgi:hypothetical protein